MSDVKLPKSLKAVPLPGISQEDRFSSARDLIAETSYRIVDPDSNSIWGYIAIDNTQRGPGLGGIRMVQDLSLNEISRLARVMTVKNSSACLPYGGAKAGITLKSFELTDNSAIREELIENLADC